MEHVYTKSNNRGMSEDIRALAQAFLIAKKSFLSTGRAGENTNQKYKYAKIDQIYEAVRSSLSENNIIIWHFADFLDNGLSFLQTRLIHSTTGQYVEDRRILEAEKPGNQAKGAANTYMRKYAVLSLCAIPTEDDDGEEEQKHIENKTETVKNEYEPSISREQLIYLMDGLKSVSNPNETRDKILNFNKIKALCDMKVSQFEGAKSAINRDRE